VAGDAFDFQSSWSAIISKCWTDEAFQKRLISHPSETLAAEGITLPSGVKVVIHANSDTTQHLVIPTKPESLKVTVHSLNEMSLGIARSGSGRSNFTGGCRST
jgi:hypothetical protein